MNGTVPKSISTCHGTGHGVKMDSRPVSARFPGYKRLVAGSKIGIRCANGFRPTCPCRKTGLGHETTIVERYQHRGYVYLAVRYWHEEPDIAVSNRLPVVYLKPYMTTGWIQNDAAFTCPPASPET